MHVENIICNIKFYRKLKGYSQEYLAFRLGISQSTYSKIEAERIPLTLTRLKEIAEILDVSVNQFVLLKTNEYLDRTAW